MRSNFASARSARLAMFLTLAKTGDGPIGAIMISFSATGFTEIHSFIADFQTENFSIADSDQTADFGAGAFGPVGASVEEGLDPVAAFVDEEFAQGAASDRAEASVAVAGSGQDAVFVVVADFEAVGANFLI